MTKLSLILVSCAVIGNAAEGTITQQQAPSGCRESGYRLIQVARGRDIIGKADSNFSVSFQGANFQANGFEESLKSAMDKWNTVSGSNFRFNFSSYTTSPADNLDGRMTISRGGLTLPFGVLAAALVSWSPTTGQIVDSDVFFHDGEPINTFPNQIEYDFEEIAIHELGHTFGLDHNDGCTENPTVMYPTLTPGVTGKILFAPEMDGVRYLYSGGRPGGGVSASPLVLDFNAVIGGPRPVSRTIAITGASGASWSASGDSWITVSPRSGSFPSTITVQPNQDGLPAGVRSGAIVFASGALTTPVVVNLNIGTSPPPVLVLGATGLSFAAIAGGPAPAAQPLNLTGRNGASWSASLRTASGGNWLRVSTASGTLPATIGVEVSATGLAPGNYAGTISVAAAGATLELPVQLEVAAQSRILLDTAQISLTAQSGTTLETCRSVRITAFADANFDWEATAGAPWLFVQPVSGRSPGSVNICATARDLGTGSYNANVTIAASGLASRAVGVSLTVTARVSVSGGGVVNAATFSPEQPIAAGEMITIFGTDLASQTVRASRFPLSTEMGDCRVLIGGIPAPLVYVSPQQVNAIVPSALAGQAGSSTTINVYSGRLAAAPTRVVVARQSPGVFTVLGGGAGAGTITHADGSLVSRANPLRAGEFISAYLTGMGSLNPAVADGAAAPANPLARATGNVRLRLDDQDAEVLFAGAAPGFAGLQVVVARVPGTLERRFPEVVVSVDGALSNRTSAGGPSLLDVSPGSVAAGMGARVILRGVNLANSIRVGSEVLLGDLSRGRDFEELAVTIPARLLAGPGAVVITAVDADAPAEHPSNPVVLAVTP